MSRRRAAPSRLAPHGLQSGPWVAVRGRRRGRLGGRMIPPGRPQALIPQRAVRRAVQ